MAESSEGFAGRRNRDLPGKGKSAEADDKAKGRPAEAGGKGKAKSEEVRQRNDERKAGRVWVFVGDGIQEAGEVHKLGKAGPGMSRVRYADGSGEEFTVQNDLLSREDGDQGEEDDGEGEAPADPAAGA